MAGCRQPAPDRRTRSFCTPRLGTSCAVASLALWDLGEKELTIVRLQSRQAQAHPQRTCGLIAGLPCEINRYIRYAILPLKVDR